LGVMIRIYKQISYEIPNSTDFGMTEL